MKQNLLTTLLVLATLLIAPATVAATDVSFNEIEINGDQADDGDILYVERGEELELDITVEANETIDVENAQIEAFIAGYRYVEFEREKVHAFSDTFDLPAGNKRNFDLELEVPTDIDQKNAKLRILVADENSDSVKVYNYQLNIEGTDESRAVQVRDFVISPSNQVEQGRATSFNVRVTNYGDRDIDDASLRVSIPALGLSTFESIDEIEVDETQSFESLLLRLPQHAEPGTYAVEATVEFDRFESTTATQQLTVVEAEQKDEAASGQQQTRVTVPDSVQVNAGQSGVFPILIRNNADESQSYTLNTDVAGWGTATFDPSNVVLVEAGSSETVYLRLTPNQETTGDQTFNVNIETDSEETSFTAIAQVQNPEPVQEDNGTDVRTILEWALVLLVVILILLGITLLVKKTGDNDNDNEEEDPDYY